MGIIRLKKPKEKAGGWSRLEGEGPVSKLGQLVPSSPGQEMNHTHALQSDVTLRKRFA